jgi:hypothetical protein
MNLAVIPWLVCNWRYGSQLVIMEQDAQSCGGNSGSAATTGELLKEVIGPGDIVEVWLLRTPVDRRIAAMPASI